MWLLVLGMAVWSRSDAREVPNRPQSNDPPRQTVRGPLQCRQAFKRARHRRLRASRDARRKTRGSGRWGFTRKGRGIGEASYSRMPALSSSRSDTMRVSSSS